MSEFLPLAYIIGGIAFTLAALAALGFFAARFTEGKPSRPYIKDTQP